MADFSKQVTMFADIHWIGVTCPCFIFLGRDENGGGGALHLSLWDQAMCLLQLGTARLLKNKVYFGIVRLEVTTRDCRGRSRSE